MKEVLKSRPSLVLRHFVGITSEYHFERQHIASYCQLKFLLTDNLTQNTNVQKAFCTVLHQVIACPLYQHVFIHARF